MKVTLLDEIPRDVLSIRRLSFLCDEAKRNERNIAFWRFDDMDESQKNECRKCEYGKKPPLIDKICCVRVSGGQRRNGGYLDDVPIFEDCVLYDGYGYKFTKNQGITNRTLNIISKLCRRELRIIEKEEENERQKDKKEA